jgi:hypothetical protein
MKSGWGLLSEWPNKGVNPTRLAPLQSAVKRALELVLWRRCYPHRRRAGYAQAAGRRLLPLITQNRKSRK